MLPGTIIYIVGPPGVGKYTVGCLPSTARAELLRRLARWGVIPAGDEPVERRGGTGGRGHPHLGIKIVDVILRGCKAVTDLKSLRDQGRDGESSSRGLGARRGHAVRSHPRRVQITNTITDEEWPIDPRRFRP